MKVLVTGASGRVGRAIHERLRDEHEVVGLDLAPSPAASIVASIEDEAALKAALRGAGAVIHVAALHAPHVSIRPDAEFEAINVRATESLLRLALEAGAGRFIFTSTTALYGAGGATREAAWVTEETLPRPVTIYHRTKIAAEKLLEAEARKGRIAVTSIRMSRCFPEPAPLMATYRLHRGIDARDVADAHAAALASATPGYRAYLVSGATPFNPEDAERLYADAPAMIERRAPALAAVFRERGWALPAKIDRVYDSARAQRELGWRPRFGFGEVLAQLDGRSLEVLPPQPAAVEIRRAIPGDAAECHRVRGLTRENPVSEARLNAAGITVDSWSRSIETDELPGFVCHSGGRLVGYCFGERTTGEVVVLVLLPGFEFRGLGRHLLGLVVELLRNCGHKRLFLGCSPDPSCRSYGFYRHLGWKSTGVFDGNGDEVLEL